MSTPTIRTALIAGLGNMGYAMLRRWRATPQMAPIRWTVIDPDAGAALRCEELGALRISPVQAEDRYDLIVAAVKPQMAAEALTALPSRAGLVMSIMAGTPLDKLQQWLVADAYVRVMPNTPAMVGEAVSGYYLPADSEKWRPAVELLLNAIGTSLRVADEDMIDKVTAVSGSGPGFLMEIARAMVAGAQDLGFSYEQARAMVAGTLVGSGQWLRSSDETPETLRNRVTSKGGTTAAGLQAMYDAQVEKAMRQAIAAAYRRATELRGA